MKAVLTLLIVIITLAGRAQEDIPETYLLLADAMTDPIEAMQINDEFLQPQFTGMIYEPIANPNRWKLVAVSSSLLLISGFSDATSEVLKIKYESFKRVFPKANDQFWDYNISWQNKYRNGTPPDARFFGSKNAFVWTTDGYHLMRMVRNVTMITAVAIPIGFNSKKTLKSYLLEGALYYVSYTSGFNLAYDVVFR